MLSDGVIAPSITVLSAVEGLRLMNPNINVLAIALIIITLLFFIQQFGTKFVGGSFGPMMVLWFLMLGITGFIGQRRLMRWYLPFQVVYPFYVVVAGILSLFGKKKW